MGCGASVPSGASPQPTVAEKPATNKEVTGSSPAPLAEDIHAAQDQESKKVTQEGEPSDAGAAEPAAPSSSQTDAGPSSAPEAAEVSTPEPVPNEDVATSTPTVATAAEGEGPQEPEPPPPAQEASPEPQPEDDPPDNPADEVTRLVLVSASEPELERSVSQSQPTLTALDPAVTPSSQTATVTLLPSEASAHLLRPRYTNESDLSFASTSFDLSGRCDDSDDDELDALFTLQAWKRYYGYNRNKHQDLLTYFWRKFPPKEYSCFCISYRDQDLLLTSYMAENCVNGFCARLDDLGLAECVFLQMYSLHDSRAQQFRIVGLLLVQGPGLPPQLAALSAFDGFAYLKADTSVALVKQFVSALLVGKSPLKGLALLGGREVL